MWPLIILTLIIAIVILVTIWVLLETQKIRSFSEANKIKYLGNGSVRFALNYFRNIKFSDDILTLYAKVQSSEKKIAISKDFGKNTLFVIDPTLIKSVLVKDFDHFVDRRKFTSGNADYLFQKMIFGMEGEKWKELRTKLSPTFTTGKIKRMFKLFDQSGQKFVQFLNSEINRTGNEEIELTGGYSKFTMDIIASAVCGIDSEAFKQKELSLFEKMGQGLQFQLGPATISKMLALAFLPPKLTDFFGIAIIAKNVQDFFLNSIKSVIRRREVFGEKGDDFIQLMLEARTGTLKTDESELEAFEKAAKLKNTTEKNSLQLAETEPLDDVGIAANCVLFMLAGFDTTQSLLLFCSYALALHQDIQDRLRSEVNSVLEESNGQLTYDVLNKMTYLDMTINETLRFYPPFPATGRICTNDYKVPGTDLVLMKGEGVTIPILGLHHDSEFFPEPELFNPERFSPENKHKVNPYTFLPFGQGPRNCIGMRFAVTEAKVAICYLVHQFKIEPSENTLIPMKYANTTTLKPEGGMYLRLTKIQN